MQYTHHADRKGDERAGGAREGGAEEEGRQGQEEEGGGGHRTFQKENQSIDSFLLLSFVCEYL